MKKTIIRVIMIAIILSIYLSDNTPAIYRNKTKFFTVPGLPKPIAKEPVIITSAGQSADIYIIKDISNRLMIRSYFLPQADEKDLKEVKTIVLVVGYSPLSLNMQGRSYEDERNRIEVLTEAAKEKNLTIIAVVMGEENDEYKKTKEILSHVLPKSSYVIGMKGSRYEGYISELAAEKDIQVTLVKGAKDIYEPFASIFR